MSDAEVCGSHKSVCVSQFVAIAVEGTGEHPSIGGPLDCCAAFLNALGGDFGVEDIVVHNRLRVGHFRQEERGGGDLGDCADLAGGDLRSCESDNAIVPSGLQCLVRAVFAGQPFAESVLRGDRVVGPNLFICTPFHPLFGGSGGKYEAEHAVGEGRSLDVVDEALDAFGGVLAPCLGTPAGAGAAIPVLEDMAVAVFVFVLNQFVRMFEAPPVWRTHVDAREKISVWVGLQRHSRPAVEFAVVIVARSDFANLRERVAAFGGGSAEAQKLYAGGGEGRKALRTRSVGGTHEAGVGRVIYMDGRAAPELLDRSGREFQILATRDVLAQSSAFRHALAAMEGDFIFAVKQIIGRAQVLCADAPFVLCADDILQREDGGRLVRRSTDSVEFQPGVEVEGCAATEGDLLSGEGEFLSALQLLLDFELFGKSACGQYIVLATNFSDLQVEDASRGHVGNP